MIADPELIVVTVEDAQIVARDVPDLHIVHTDVEGPSIVVTALEHSIVSRDAQDLQVVVLETLDQQIMFAGEQGPPGPPGAADIEVAFSFGDATPAPLTTVPAGKLVYGVELYIKTPFDGAGAALSVGDAGQADRLLSAAENDISTAGGYFSTPAYAYAAPTVISLNITPGAGATQGAGVIVLRIQQ